VTAVRIPMCVRQRVRGERGRESEGREREGGRAVPLYPPCGAKWVGTIGAAPESMAQQGATSPSQLPADLPR
jgi:hypothetical protein